MGVFFSLSVLAPASLAARQRANHLKILAIYRTLPPVRQFHSHAFMRQTINFKLSILNGFTQSRITALCYSIICLIVFIQILFHAILGSSIISKEFYSHFGYKFLCTETIITSLMVFIGCAFIQIVRKINSKLNLYAFYAFYAIYSLFISTSWTQYFYTKVFLTAGGITLGFYNPIDTIQHALHFHPFSLAMFLIVIAIILSLIHFTRIVITKYLPLSICVAINVFCPVLLLVIYWNSFSFSLVPINVSTPYAHEAGNISTYGDYATDVFLNESGPHVSLISSGISNNDNTFNPDETFPVNWKKIISLKEYIKTTESFDHKNYNVLLIVVESLRSEIVEPGVNQPVVMENLEAIAKRSVVFTNHFSTSTHSNYSDLAPLSSHWPLRQATTHVYPENPTYPRVLIYDILKEFKYRTAIVSSQNENWGKMINYLDTGGVDDLLHSANYSGDTSTLQHSRFWINQKSGKVDDYHTVNRAIDWISLKMDTPFFMYLNLQNSHFPYSVGSGFKRRFGKDRDQLEHEPSFIVGSVDQVEEQYAQYLDSLAYVDVQIGRLLSWLEDSELLEKTIVLVTGDTGQGFMEHGFFGHANKLYNELLKTPLIIFSPGLDPRSDNQLAQHIDIPPTVLGLLGLPPHPSHQGIDLFNCSVSNNRPIFFVAQSPLAKEYAVIRGNWKLVYQPFPKEYRLFDLSNDEFELINRASEEIEVVDQLSSILHTWCSLQISYYQDVSIHKIFYPPLLDLSVSVQDSVHLPWRGPG